jgi:hypothetical protein
LSFIALALSGCTVEQKLASSFVKTGINDEFIILNPDFLFKYNLKTYEVPGIDSLDESTKDSLLLANSLFLKDINDEEIIDEFVSSFIKTLKTYNVRSYPENYLDTFLAIGRKAVILNFAQFSLEEYVHPYSTEEFVDYEVIVIDNIDLNALNYNIWLELSHLNSEGEQKVLFTSDYLLDNIDGTLKQYLFTGEMQFDYTIDTTTPARIHKFASDFGKTTAGYLYDYYLNQYIGENLPVDYGYERYYYHYDPKKPKPYPADPEDRFIELKK